MAVDLKMLFVALGAALVGATTAIVWTNYPKQLGDTLGSVSKLRAGMPYDDARKILVDAGWQPFKFPAQTSQEQGCLIRAEVCSKYIETEACSGTGLGYCSFLFADVTGKRLRVVTIGEDVERLTIDRWKIEETREGARGPSGD